VDDFGVELAEQRAEILGAVHEEGVVNFVDVVFVENHPVETAHLPRNPFGSESLGAVELIREPDAGYRNGNGGKHQNIFCWRRLRNCLRDRKSVVKGWRGEVSR